MKKWSQWIVAVILFLFAAPAVSQSPIGGICLFAAVALSIPPIWRKIYEKTRFAHRHALIAVLAVIGMIFWESSPKFAEEVAANHPELKETQKANTMKAVATADKPEDSGGRPTFKVVRQISGQRPVQPLHETTAPDERPGILHYQVESKERLLGILRDAESARFDDVYLHTTVHDGKKAYSYCGTVNAKNGFGGYSGKEKFIAGPTIAVTRSQMTDFTQAWKILCTGTSEKVFYF